MGWFKSDPPPPLPEPQPVGIVSQVICAILGTKSDVQRHNDAIAAAQESLKRGQQIIIRDKATNKYYKELMAHHGGKNLPTATLEDGITQVVNVPGKHGGVDQVTIVHGVEVSRMHRGEVR